MSDRISDTRMYSQVVGFPDQIEAALDADLGELPDFDNICICGIGSSALSGDIIADYTAEVSDTFIPVIRGIWTPRWITSKTLAIIVSYSGNTHETLISYKQIMSRGARIIALTSGGQLRRDAEEHGSRVVLMPTGLQSRGALGYMIGYLANIIQRLGVCDASDELRSMLPALRNRCAQLASEDGEAREIASRLYGKVPVIYTPANMQSSAVRWKNQINENCKTMCFDGSIPEFNHNEIIGWTDDESNNKKFVPVVLYDDGASGTLKSMIEASMKVVGDKEIMFTVHHFNGDSNLEKNLRCIILGDFVSLYLADLYGVDPSTDDAVLDAKKHLLG